MLSGGAMDTTNQKNRRWDVFGCMGVLTGVIGMITGLVGLSVSLGMLPKPVDDYVNVKRAYPYFEDLALRDTPHVKRMTYHTLSGSVAEKFATFQYYYSKARDEGKDFQDSPQVVKRGRDFINLCKSESTADEDCINYKNFDVQQDKLVSFDINGIPIEDRLFVDSEKPENALGAELRMLAAFQGKSQLYIAIRITTNQDPVMVDWQGSKYRNPSGKISRWTGTLLGRKGQIPPHVTNNFIAIYGRASIGGSLELPLATPGEVTSEVTMSTGSL